MSFHRGDVVIVDFYPTDPRAKVRPALVVQNDRDNARMQRTIVVQITSNASRSHEDTQYLIDSAHPDWSKAGLRLASAVNAANLATISRRQVTHVIGGLSAATMRQIDACLRAALGLLVLLLIVAAVPMPISLAAKPAKADDTVDAARKAAGDAKQKAVAAGTVSIAPADWWEREEKSSGIPLHFIFTVMDSVEGQKELKLTDDQKVKARYALLSKALGPNSDPREYQSAEQQEKEVEAAKSLIDLLSPEQIGRLKQLGLQVRGLDALTMPAVVSALGMTDEQRKKLEDIQSQFHKSAAPFDERRRAIYADRKLSPAERQSQLAPLSEEEGKLAAHRNEAALGALTPQQREKFDNMKGAKFTFSFHSIPQDDQRDRLLDLLWRYTAVRDELKVTLAQEEKLNDVWQWESEHLPEEHSVLQREMTLAEVAKSIEDTLTPQQMARLKQICLQRDLGDSPATFALLEPDVAAALGIHDDQRQKLQELISKGPQKLASNKAAKEAALAILTPQQREKFETLQGARCRTNLQLGEHPIGVSRFELIKGLPVVQDGLKLTDGQKEKLKEFWKGRQRPEKTTDHYIALLQRRKAAEEDAKAVEGILTLDQSARLKQIYLQWLLHEFQAASILTMPDMLPALEISDEQQEKLEKLTATPNHKQTLNSQRNMPEEKRKQLQQLMKTEDDQALAILTRQQREKLAAMKGAEFPRF